MAAAFVATAIPVWLSEEDLSCIICQELLDCATTLPCGHSFCLRCLQDTWVSQQAGVDGCPWACPLCREGPAAKPKLHKNTLLQDLVDKYRRAAQELEAGPEPAAPPGSPRRSPPAQVTVQKSTTEVIQELTKLVGQLIDVVNRLEIERSGLSSGVGKVSSSDEYNSYGSPKPVTSSASPWKIPDILHNLEEIQDKLQGIDICKEAPGEQIQESLQRQRIKEEKREAFNQEPRAPLYEEVPSSSLCPPPDQGCPVPRDASQLALWAISPTFDLRSISCNLEVSNNWRRVTVSRYQQPYPWSCERFLISQVLCSQALSSGKKYWEVDTRNCNHWAVGVASWRMKRDQVLGRTEDSWCIEWKGPGQFSAWAMVKKTDLPLGRPEVVGVWLDLELMKLAFYSVADQRRLLYECEVSASAPLHPAFWVYGLSPGNYLEIKQVRS